VLDPAFGYLIIAGAALLFASASVRKLQDLARFTENFAAYRVLPAAWAQRLAWLVPCIEFAIAIALLWEPGRRAGAASAIAVLLAYGSAMGVNLLRGRRDLDCGCGAARDRRAIAPWMVWRNLLLAAAIGTAALPWSSRALGPTDALTFMGGLLAGVLLYAAADRLFGDVAPKTAVLRRTS
jgi:Methylamine utilisation protein MauE